jgi:hypothetical protein
MTDEPNLLEAMEAVEKAAERATPRPWSRTYTRNRYVGDARHKFERSESTVSYGEPGSSGNAIAIVHTGGKGALHSDMESVEFNAEYIALAANHAPEFVKAIRALRKVARAAVEAEPEKHSTRTRCESIRANVKRHAAIAEFQSGPYAGLLEGGRLMPRKTEPTDQRIVEILAVDGKGWHLGVNRRRRAWVKPNGKLGSLLNHFDPLADLNAIHDLEERLTGKQWGAYHLVLEAALMKQNGANGVWAMTFRHAGQDLRLRPSAGV